MPQHEVEEFPEAAKLGTEAEDGQVGVSELIDSLMPFLEGLKLPPNYKPADVKVVEDAAK